MEDSIMNEVLRKNCEYLAEAVKEGNKEAIKNAEGRIVATAMVMAGFRMNTDTGLYEETKECTE